MSKEISAGFILESNGFFLLGHARNSSFDKSFEQALKEASWTIPKGKLNPGETPLSAALRETYEETGMMVYEWLKDDVDILKGIAVSNIYKTTANKKVIVFHVNLIEKASKIFTPVCVSLVDTVCPWRGQPELDHFIWAPKDLAHSLVFKTQKVLFE